MVTIYQGTSYPYLTYPLSLMPASCRVRIRPLPQAEFWEAPKPAFSLPTVGAMYS